MHAIDRLRHVARSGDLDATEFACEAAYALGGLSRDRRALVLAGRRLLEFHPRCGPLWWVIAHALVSDDLRATLADCIDQLERDATIDELFALPDSQSVVVAEATRTVVRGLCERADLAARLVGDPYSVRSGLRFFGDALIAPQGFGAEETVSAMDGSDAVVVEALAAGPLGFLFDRAGERLARQAMHSGTVLWVVAGIGRVLPAELFDVLISHLATDADTVDHSHVSDAERAGLVDLEGDRSMVAQRRNEVLVPVAAAALVVTSGGLRDPAVVFHPNPVVSHQRCPVPEELLAPFGVAG